MNEFLQTLVSILQFLWPFRTVEHWERGGLYWWGRYRGEKGPGIYPVIPFFMDIRAISTQPTPVSTPRLDITLKDGTLLTCIATAIMQVVDFDRAFNCLEEYKESAIELLTAIVADRLADFDINRLAPENRRKLLRSLRDSINIEASDYGLKVDRVRFITFIMKSRALRLVGDTAGSGW